MNAEELTVYRDSYLKAISRSPDFLYLDAGALIAIEKAFTEPVLIETRPESLFEKRDEFPGRHEKEPSPESRLEGKKHSSVFSSLGNTLVNHQYLVFLGEAGAGKTTALNFISLNLAQTEPDDPNPALDFGTFLPVKLSLQTYASDYRFASISLQDAIIKEISTRLACKNSVGEAVFESWSQQGQLLILLDGLDEVLGLREETVKQILDFCKSAGQSKTRMIVTSRLAGYRSLGTPFREFILTTFSQPEQVHSYLEHWLCALWPALEATAARHESQKILEHIKVEPGLAGISDNPLLLSLLVRQYVKLGEIAKDRTELYKAYIEELWERAVKRGTDRVQKESIFRTLEGIAWHLQNNGDSSWKQVNRGIVRDHSVENDLQADTNLKIINQHMGLVGFQAGRIVFSHAAFREYFAGRRLGRAWRHAQNTTWEFIKPRLHQPEWKEPLYSLAGELDEAHLEDLLRRILKAASSYEKYLHRDLLLASALLAGKSATNLKALQQVGRSLLRQYKKERQASPKISLAEALGQSIFPDLIPELLKLYKKRDEFGWVAKKILKNIKNPLVVPALAKFLLEDPNARVKQAAAMALGTIGHAEALPALIKAAGQDRNDISNCEEVILAIGRIATPEAVAFLLSLVNRQGTYQNRAILIKALGLCGKPDAVPYLLEERKDIGLRDDALEALRQTVKSENIPDLVREIQSSRQIRKELAYILGSIQDPQAFEALRSLLESKEEPVRQTAVVGLGFNRHPDAIPTLAKIIATGSPGEKLLAVEALGEPKEKNAWSILVQCLDDDLLQYAAITAIKFNPSPLAIPKLVEICTHGRIGWVEKLEILYAIGDFPDASVLALLRDLLDDSNPHVRDLAIQKLAIFDAHDLVPRLLEIVEKSEFSWMRHSAGQSLAKLALPEHRSLLEAGLNNPVPAVREACLEALGHLALSETYPVVVDRFRNDHNSAVREAAVTALGRIGKPAALPDLFRALKDIPGEDAIHRAAPFAIWQITFRWPTETISYDKRRQIKALITVARAYHEKHLDNFLLGTLEILEGCQLPPAFDPLYPPPAPRWRRAVLWTSLIVLSAGLSGLVAILSEISDTSSNWGAIFAIGLVIGLLGWLVDEISSRLKKKTSNET